METRIQSRFISARRFIITLLLVSSSSTWALPEELTDFEKGQLLEKLEKIRDAAEKSSLDRFGVALRAFRDAVKSDAAAHDLYLKCTEKANFEDQKRSSQEFREWKRRHKETTDCLEFRRALQHQLSWLLLTVEASAEPDKMDTLGRRALDKIDAIMDDEKMLQPHRGILQQDVLSSVYARAYNINGLKAKNWPKSALHIGEIYDKVVMPPLRNVSTITQLRSAWKKRIEHEGLILKNWGKVPQSSRVGMKKDMLPPEYIKWMEEGYVDMLWQQEMECYSAGDQKQAATNMLSHLSKYIKHKKSLKWAGEFEKLMATSKEEVVEDAAERNE